MAINTSAGTEIFIGPVTSATDVSALAGLSYVKIGKMGSIGEIGPQAQDVTFTPLDGTPIQHFKGSVDNGAVAMTMARDPLDAGQIALKAASATKFEYALKIVTPDAADGNDTDTIYYCRGPVMPGRTNIGDANTVRTIAYAVGLNVFEEVASEAVSGT